MAEPYGSAQVTWPVTLPADDAAGSVCQIREHLWLGLTARVLESRLLKLLRFLHGEASEHILRPLRRPPPARRLPARARGSGRAHPRQAAQSNPRPLQVYSVSVSAFFGMECPSNPGALRGDVAACFSCAPEGGARLLALARAELGRLQACADVTLILIQILIQILILGAGPPAGGGAGGGGRGHRAGAGGAGAGAGAAGEQVLG